MSWHCSNSGADHKMSLFLCGVALDMTFYDHSTIPYFILSSKFCVSLAVSDDISYLAVLLFFAARVKYINEIFVQAAHELLFVLYVIANWFV